MQPPGFEDGPIQLKRKDHDIGEVTTVPAVDVAEARLVDQVARGKGDDGGSSIGVSLYIACATCLAEQVHP